MEPIPADHRLVNGNRAVREGMKALTETTRPPGKTTIAPDVLLTIARLTVLSVPGVNHLAAIPGGVDRLFARGASEGVRISVENDIVYVDLYVVLNGDCNIREASRAIQNQVARAINEMVGMEVGKVNVHIEDITFEETRQL